MPLFDECRHNVEDEHLKARLVQSLELLSNRESKNLLEALIVLLDFYKENLKVHRTWHRLRKFIGELPHSNQSIEIFNSDARSLPVDNDSVDLVITSPPYINVFNYHQQYRASAEALGWDVLAVAKSEIGSNRKHRGNRFLTVVEYCLDMSLAMSEIKRICRKNAHIIFVVGRESRVKNTPFYNSQIVTLLGMRCVDLKVSHRQERVFKNKFGMKIYEDILHFALTDKSNGSPLNEARIVAFEVLKSVFDLAPIESRRELLAAIDRVAEITPSQIYQSVQIH